MRRHLLGSIALILIGVATFVWYQYGDRFLFEAGILLRTGLLMGAVWLALPQLTQLLTRFPFWLLAGVTISLLVLVVRPRLYLLVFVFLVVLGGLQFVGWLLKPPPGKKRDQVRK